MNLWAVSTRLILASLQAALMFRRPAVKFSMVGTRPKACRAKKVTTEPEPDGNRMPTFSPGLVMAAILRPSAKLARIRSV
jgi:hypothetical protein